jgi:hypothetical protein
MSEAEREIVKEEMRRTLKRWAMIVCGAFLFWFFMSRKPHTIYSEYNGMLVPVNPQMAQMPQNA